MTPPISEQQTVSAGQTSFALGTPYPTITFHEGPTAPVPMGIGTGCAEGGGPSEYDLANCWVGRLNEGEYLNVDVGAPKSDPEQGVLKVYTTTAEWDSGPKQFYNTPTRSGPLFIANVTWPHMTLVTWSTDTSIPTVTFLFNLESRTWEVPGQCKLFPIALSADLLQGLHDYYGTHDTSYGIESRSFGWLSWDGSTITDTLTASLSPPGDSSSYTNPDNPADHTVSIGDWVLGRPEVEGGNSPPVESAMSNLAIGDKTYSIPSSYVLLTVPVWDQAIRQGESIRYHISSFVWMSIDHYSLAHPNSISLHYSGHSTCPDSP